MSKQVGGTVLSFVFFVKRRPWLVDYPFARCMRAHQDVNAVSGPFERRASDGSREREYGEKADEGSSESSSYKKKEIIILTERLSKILYLNV